MHVLFFLTSCISSAGLQFSKIPPSKTGPVDDIGSGHHHLVYLPEQPLSDTILVFLPGTTWPPDYYTKFLQESASLDITTIGLAYDWLNVSIAVFNENFAHSDSSAWGRCHEAVVFGGKCPAAEVEARNSISSRIGYLLKYLGIIHDAEQIPWEKIIISGHSQGGTHCSFMAKMLPMKALLSFSGQGEENAGWTKPGFATKLLKMVNHELEFCIDNINRNLQNFEIGERCVSDGNPVNEACVAVYLSSKVVPRNLTGLHPYHESSLVDFQTPEDTLKPLWRSLLLQAADFDRFKREVMVQMSHMMIRTHLSL